MPLTEFLAAMAAALLKTAAPFTPFIAAGLLASWWACHRPSRARRNRRGIFSRFFR